METRNYWEENGHAVKYENYNSNDGFARATGCSDQLNFAAPSEDEVDYQSGNFLKKGKVSRQDPMSHRIIEKRRRDRMNNCLADLSRLIPPEYLKKGRGRVEKTEIIEMAIRHLKYLQERANGLYHANKGKSEYGNAPVELYKAGFQDAAAEAVRFLVEVQGHGSADGLCVQMSSHLQRHCDQLIKSEQPSYAQEKFQLHGSSSETTSSSGSSHGYSVKATVIARTDIRTDIRPDIRPDIRDDPVDPIYAGSYENAPTDDGPYPDCDVAPANCEESIATDRKKDTQLRAVRKTDTSDDYLHSYKFKNSIERRFSRSQDYEVHDMSVRAVPQAKVFSHKRRRTAKPITSTSTSNSGSNCGSNSGSNSGTNSGSNSGSNSGANSSSQSGSNSGSNEDATDTSPQDTSSESPHRHYDKPAPPTQYVPVFALNALGKYYVPLSVEYGCLSRQLSQLDSLDVLDARAAQQMAPLHPITIHVNFQPCLNYHLKREPEQNWDERNRVREHNYTPH